MTRTIRELLLAFGIVFLALALPSLTCMGWFFFDGAVTYPRQQERWAEYERVIAENPTNPRQAWAAYASNRGWPTEVPPPRTDIDVLTQHIMGGVCAASSLVLAAAGATMLVLSRRGSSDPSATTMRV